MSPQEPATFGSRWTVADQEQTRPHGLMPVQAPEADFWVVPSETGWEPEASTYGTALTSLTLAPSGRPSARRAQLAGAAIPPGTRVQGMEKWTGQVTDVEEHSFTAELIADGDAAQTVYADFDIAVVDSADQELVQPGAALYVTVRTVRERGGRVTRTVSVRMRRLGVWQESEINELLDEARARAAELQRFVE